MPPLLAEVLALFNEMPTTGMSSDVCCAPTCSNAWTGGAENHQPATEGDWNERRLRALQGGLSCSPCKWQMWLLDAWHLQRITSGHWELARLPLPCFATDL